MPGQHAVLSPSASKRWLACPPSARLNAKLNERFGNKSSSFAEEGTKAHSLAELKLRHELGETNKFLFKSMVDALGDIPKEMDRNTDRYVDTVLEKYYAAKRQTPDAKLLVEVKLDMSRWAPNCWGTSDSVVVSDQVLVVMDYKNGSGVPVSAIDNPQARLYALGAVNEFGDLYGFTEVHTLIVQPKLDSITEEVLTKEELLAWGESIHDTAVLADKGYGKFKTGDHCRFCAARAICAARAEEAMRVFQHGFDAPAVIPDNDIPGILEVLPTAKAWIKDLEEYALNQAKLGTEFRGYKLVHGRRPGRKWKNEDAVIDILARAGYTEDQYRDAKLKSPADMEKLLGGAAFRALLSGEWAQGEGALTLVPEEDTRVEVTSAEAALSDLLD